MFASKKRIKTPIVFQTEPTECGAACLSIILRYYKTFLPLEIIREECGISRDGASAEKIIMAADKFGLIAKKITVNPENLTDHQGPYIALWKEQHFLVIEHIDQNYIYLNDPSTGPRSLSRDEFKKNYSGIIIVFETKQNFKPEGHAPRLYMQLASRLKGQEKYLAFLLLAGIGITLFTIFFPIINKIFVDVYLIADQGEIILPLIYSMIIAILFRFAIGILQDFYLIRLEAKLAIVFSADFVSHILTLPMRFFSLRQTGDILFRIISINKIANIIASVFIKFTLDALVGLIFLALLFIYDPIIALITLIFLSINLIILIYVARLRKTQSERLVTDLGTYYTYAHTAFQMMPTLKSSGREIDFFGNLMGAFNKAHMTLQDLNKKTFFLNNMPNFLSMALYAMILVYGSYNVLLGHYSLGTLVAIQSIMLFITTPVKDLVQVANQIQVLQGYISRVDDLKNYSKTNKNILSLNADSIKADLINSTKLSGHIQIKNLSFGYNKTEEPLIKNLDLEILPGECIALVGSSGSGKSTISKLITGLYEPWNGEILIDGVNLKTINKILLAKSVSIVDQNVTIFTGSIKDNVTIWDKTIPFSKIIQACKDAAIHQDITEKKNGYDTLLSEDVSILSYGQRQQIEIARSLVNNPNILILDEASSALDPITESIVENNIKKRGCTTIIVAHRLSAVRYSDKIYVIDKGKIIESGTHNELISKQGKYFELMCSGE